MNHETALSILRISSRSPGREEIITAFTILSRRYPLQGFPEKNVELREARDYLLDPSISIREIFESSEMDISWLERYQSQEQKLNNNVSLSVAPSKKDLVAALMRPVFQNAEPDFFGNLINFLGKRML